MCFSEKLLLIELPPDLIHFIKSKKIKLDVIIQFDISGRYPGKDVVYMIVKDLLSKFDNAYLESFS